jgi:hypothetical protein
MRAAGVLHDPAVMGFLMSLTRDLPGWVGRLVQGLSGLPSVPPLVPVRVTSRARGLRQ